MAEVVINEQYLVDIADKIRSLNGSTETYKPGEMATAIRALENKDDEILGYLNDTATTFSNSNITNIKSYAFQYHRKLTKVSLPNLQSVPLCCFEGCKALTEVNLPNVTEAEARAFEGCTSLKRLDLPKAKIITYDLLEWDVAAMDYFEALILRNNEVCTVDYEGDVSESFWRGAKFYIYVPQALVNSYKTAPFWRYCSSQIRAIEDYPDICG